MAIGLHRYIRRMPLPLKYICTSLEYLIACAMRRRRKFSDVHIFVQIFGLLGFIEHALLALELPYKQKYYYTISNLFQYYG